MIHLSNKEIIKYVSNMEQYKVKCDCGHSILMTALNKKGYKICTHCGKKIYKEQRDEFKDRLLKEMKK